MTLPPPPPPPPPSGTEISGVTSRVNEPVRDDRDGGTRRKLLFFDRIKYLLFLAALFGFFVWNEQANLPILSWADAYRRTVNSKWWIFVLFGLEVIREIHYLISERSARWYTFWRKSFFGAFDRMLDRIPPGPRWRLGRLTRLVFFVVVLSLVLGRIFDTSPVLAIVELPSRAVVALPFAFQMLFLFFVIIIQFVGLGWWISRQGINVYMPEEVKTRFSDVWGQDHVVSRVKENMIFLDDPDAIEAKGGYVPGGILLWGPPGTGKTLLAEAVAGETGKPYVFVEPGAFNSPVMGGGIIAVKALFRKLRKLSTRFGGVIVFFDEADVIGNRGALAGGLGGQATPGSPANPRFHTHTAADSCNCLSYLSPMAVDTLARAEAGLAPAGPHRDGFMMGGMGGGGGGMLQSLLTEMSGLKKPRGITNKLRKWIGMRPKEPPKYRILVMMATNMPSALDEALLRPGRLDRIYKVGYPSLEGRKRTYQGYLAKVRHVITPDEVDQIARMTPYATGATIKDLVNEALITAYREQREVISFADLLKAKQARELGPPEDFEYVARERHAVAIHEACHAVAAYRKRHHLVIDIATIERRGDVGGFVSSIPPEDRFTHWKSEYEADLTVALASLAGERLFFEGDNSSGVGGDLGQATMLATTMEGYWGMGSTVASHGVQRDLGVGGGGGGGGGAPKDGKDDGDKVFRALGTRIEDNLQRILAETLDLLMQHRYEVLAVAHALETHQTLSGPDLIAVMEGTQGPIVDGRIYRTEAFYDAIDVYHRAAVAAHKQHERLTWPLPRFAVHEVQPIPAFVHTDNGHGNGDNPWGTPPGWDRNGKR